MEDDGGGGVNSDAASAVISAQLSGLVQEFLQFYGLTGTLEVRPFGSARDASALQQPRHA